MTRKFLALGAIVCLSFAVGCSARTAEVGEGDDDASATTVYPDDPDASPPTVTVDTDASFIGDDGGVTTSYDASAGNDASATYDSSCPHPPPPPPPPPCGCMDPDASSSDDASADPVPVEP